MCIIIGKYFPGRGWVAFKNRDRNYVPEISFRRKKVKGAEIMYFWDDITQYCEGFNSAGVGVLSASLMVLDDEKEIQVRTKTPSKDGVRIKKALKYADPTAVAMFLIKKKLTGNTLVFSKDRMILIEGARQDGEYHHRVKELDKDDIVVRTNHGVMLPWAGYQRQEDDTAQTLSRISSDSRKLIAEDVAAQAKEPEDVLNGLIKDYTGNPQLNAVRQTHKKKLMRTTSQIMICPEEKTMYVRPIQSHIQYNFWKMNHQDHQTWVEILSNRELYKNLKNKELDRDPHFAHNLNHNANEKTD